MKRLLLSLLLLCAQGAQADAVSDAFNAGSSYGKSNSSQGTSGMKNTSPSTVIPGYTASPSQSGYYGGVQGGTVVSVTKDRPNSVRTTPGRRLSAPARPIRR